MSSGRPTGVWRRTMRGRDPREEHRAATPLELFFDLCFVAAVSQAATELHDVLAEGDLVTGLFGYAGVFFAIWWAWVNFTWFASAYDTDDVPYRLLTLLQMGGVLVLAAGVPAAFEEFDFTVVVIGYVIMRAALITQWLRAAAEDPEGRAAALRYALGIGVVQVGWIARLWAPGVWAAVTFAILVIAELAVPAWAEARGRATRWHPEHIAERYSLFTIIVLGEAILGSLAGMQSTLTEYGLSTSLVLTAVGGLVLVFALWWIYFTGLDVRLSTMRTALTWGYVHYLVFAAIAALGAGLEVAVDAAAHHTGVSDPSAAQAVAVPVVVFLLVLAPLHHMTGTGAVATRRLATNWFVLAGAVVVLALAFTPAVLGVGGAVLGMGLAAAATLAANLITTERRRARVGA